MSVLVSEESVIVAFVSVVLAVPRPRNIPRALPDAWGVASTTATFDLVPVSSTRRTVVTTLNVHSSVTDCPSKMRSRLEGPDVMFTDSIGEQQHILSLVTSLRLETCLISFFNHSLQLMILSLFKALNCHSV